MEKLVNDSIYSKLLRIKNIHTRSYYLLKSNFFTPIVIDFIENPLYVSHFFTQALDQETLLACDSAEETQTCITNSSSSCGLQRKS